MTPWFRQNKIALFALPVLLVIAVLASSFRLQLLKSITPDTDLVVTKEPSVTFTEPFHSSAGDLTRTVKITVASVDRAPAFKNVSAPPGGELTTVTVEFEAEPDQLLIGCQGLLIDTLGNQYDSLAGKEFRLPGTYPVGDFDKSFSCTPAEATGPTDFGEEITDPGPQRPKKFIITSSFVTPIGAELAALRISWQAPTGVELGLPKN